MENKETITDSFKRELEAVSTDKVLDPAYRKRKLGLWIVRATIAIVLYIIFWKYDWVKWTLLLTIPASLFSLFTIVVYPYLIEKKIEKVRRKIEEAERIVQNTTVK